MASIADRIRLELLVQRLDYHLSDLPGARRRQVHRVRADTRAAAADVGLRQALANLGHPRVLAAGYLAAEVAPCRGSARAPTGRPPSWPSTCGRR